MQLKDFLSERKEKMPDWLALYKSDSKVPFSDFMSGRVGYYPGSGFDGNLIKVCNTAHCCHSFLYVDYLITKNDLEKHLQEKNCVSGYHMIGFMDYSMTDLIPSGGHPMNFNVLNVPRFVINLANESFCSMMIYERNAEKDDTWGAERIAITFLHADGICTYYQLFCKEYKKAPWIFLLQDHGFGGNYDRFGKGGILDKIIKLGYCYPEYVICANNTSIWNGYIRHESLVTSGGMHKDSRCLYTYSPDMRENQ